MLTIEFGVVIVFWACCPIYFKHMSFRIRRLTNVSKERSNWIRYIYFIIEWSMARLIHGSQEWTWSKINYTCHVEIGEFVQSIRTILVFIHWNSASSSANTSSLERLVPIFTSHVLETIGQSRTFFFVITHIPFDVIRAGPKLMFHIVGGTKFLLQPFVSWAGVSCLPLPTFALHKVLVLTCIVQYLWPNLGTIFQTLSTNS